jgi:large subunit ribosomal protein L25
MSTDQPVVTASTGREIGTRPSRRLRREGVLPGVVYGMGKDPVTVSVAYNDLRDVLKAESGLNTVFTLDVGGDHETVLVRDLQRDVIKSVVTHADFLRVDPNKPIEIEVPIALVGEATEAEQEGAVIEQRELTLTVMVAPNAIPDQLDLDISAMSMENDTLTLAAVSLPPGVSTEVDLETVLAVASIPQVIEEPVEDEASDVEGEEGEGEATAGGDDSGDAGAGDEEE